MAPHGAFRGGSAPALPQYGTAATAFPLPPPEVKAEPFKNRVLMFELLPRFHCLETPFAEAASNDCFPSLRTLIGKGRFSS